MNSSARVLFSVVGEDSSLPHSKSSAEPCAEVGQEAPAGAALSLEAWIAQAKTLLSECAQDLNGFLNAEYPFRDLYPDEKRKWERDRALIQQVEALLAAAPPVQQVPASNPALGQGEPVL
jgi:hypothetical protein